MRFRSCFLVSHFLVFGFPLAVRKEDISDALQIPEVGLSIRDDTDDSTDSAATSFMSLTSDGQGFMDQPLADKAQPVSTQDQFASKDSTGLSNLVPSTGSTLLAQSLGNDLGTGVLPAVEGAANALPGAAAAGLSGLGATFLLLNGRIHDVNLLLNDNPTGVHVKSPFDSKNVPGTKGGATTPGSRVLPGGTGAVTDQGGGTTDTASYCPPDHFGLRTLVWCDTGDPSSAELRYEGIVVHGYRCTLSPNHPPSHSLFFDIHIKIN